MSTANTLEDVEIIRLEHESSVPHNDFYKNLYSLSSLNISEKRASMVIRV